MTCSICAGGGPIKSSHRCSDHLISGSPGAGTICSRCGSLYCPVPDACSFPPIHDAVARSEVATLRARVEKLEAPIKLANRGYVPLEELRAAEMERDAWKKKHDVLDESWERRMSNYKRESDAKVAEAQRSRDEARAHVDKMQSRLAKLGQEGVF